MRLNEMPPHARVWVYTAGRELTATEQSRLLNDLLAFVSDWRAHGTALSAAADVLHNRYLVLAADESEALASGCSIDASVRALKAMGAELKVDFFVRTLVSYRQGDEVITVPVHDFWALRKAHRVNDDTLVFNSVAKTVGDLGADGWQPFSESWHAEMWR